MDRNEIKKQFYKSEIDPTTKVKIVAGLENKYFLKTNNKEYIFLDLDSDYYEIVSEETVASAILNHGYKPLLDERIFEFKERRDFLKNK
jgi:hypothetical protein